MAVAAQNGFLPGFVPGDPPAPGAELTRRGLEGALDVGIAAGTGVLVPKGVVAGRAAVQAGKALARDPRVFVETTNFSVNFARGVNLGRNLNVFERPLGFGPGSIAGHALGVGVGVASRVGRFVGNLF